jgi:hypothetical protein
MVERVDPASSAITSSRELGVAVAPAESALVNWLSVNPPISLIVR